MMRIHNLLKKVKVILFVLWIFIIIIKPTNVLGDEYKAKYWIYGSLINGTIGYPGLEYEIFPVTVGIGANLKFIPGIGIGTSLANSMILWNHWDTQLSTEDILPIYFRLLMPLSNIRAIEKYKDFYLYPSVFHLFAKGSVLGPLISHSSWFEFGGGMDLKYGVIGLVGGYFLHQDGNRNRTSFLYMGIKLAIGGWHPQSVEKFYPPVRPPPKIVKPAEVITEKMKTVPEYSSAPNFSLLSLEEGIILSLSELLGKRTVLYFWTPLSSPIKDDMIKLQELYSKYRNDGLRVIAILAFPDDSAEALAFVDSAKISFVNLIGDRKTALEYRVADAAPAIVIINENKKIIATEKSNLNDELLKIIVPSRSVSLPPPLPLPASTKTEIVYLSDIKPIKAEVGHDGLKNDNFRGNPIKLDDVTYKKGLSTHAPASVSYNLDGKYKKFESFIGLWDSGNPNRGVPGDFAGKRGSVIFQVWLDGTKKYDSGILYWNDKRQISISVEKATVMVLVVEVDGDGNRWDWAVWGDAKLVK